MGIAAWVEFARRVQNAQMAWHRESRNILDAESEHIFFLSLYRQNMLRRRASVYNDVRNKRGRHTHIMHNDVYEWVWELMRSKRDLAARGTSIVRRWHACPNLIPIEPPVHLLCLIVCTSRWIILVGPNGASPHSATCLCAFCQNIYDLSADESDGCMRLWIILSACETRKLCHLRRSTFFGHFALCFSSIYRIWSVILGDRSEWMGTHAHLRGHACTRYCSKFLPCW